MAEQIQSGAAEGLWRYACDFYAREGSEHLLLALQDEQGADVLLLIAACWVASRSLALDDGEWQAVVAWQTPFREQIIEPLRQARRSLLAQTGRSALYDQVKAAELAAEKAQLMRLESHLAQRGKYSKPSVVQELLACCTAQEIQLEGAMKKRLDSLAQLA